MEVAADNLDNIWKQEFKPKAKIFELLNHLGKIIIKDYNPIIVRKEEEKLLTKYAKERLGFIIEGIDNNNIKIKAYSICYAFSCLFLGKKEFKMENSEMKFKYFDAILNDLENKKEFVEYENLELPDDIVIFCESIFKEPLCFKIAAVIFTLEMNSIKEYLIKLIQKSFDVILDFNYDDLDLLEVDVVTQDLLKIFLNKKMEAKETNYIHLKIENKHILEYSYSIDEINECIISLDANNNKVKSNKVPKKKENKKKGSKKKNELNQLKNLIKEENREQEQKKTKDINIHIKGEQTNQDKKPQIKIDKLLGKTKINNIKTNKEQNLQTPNEQPFLQIKTIIIEKQLDFIIKNKNVNFVAKEEEIDNKSFKFEEMNQKIKSLEKKLKEVEIRNEKYKKDFIELKNKYNIKEEENKKYFSKIKELQKENKNLKYFFEQKFNKLNKDLINFENNANKLESELKLIEMREPFKIFIDYIYFTCGFTDSNSYEYKMNLIHDYLNSNLSKVNKGSTRKKLKYLIYLIYKNLKMSNELAHKFDVRLSIIEQIFSNIFPKEFHEFEIIKDIIQKNGGDDVMKAMILNRKNNYYNLDIMKKNEKIILSKVKDIKFIFKI